MLGLRTYGCISLSILSLSETDPQAADQSILFFISLQIVLLKIICIKTRQNTRKCMRIFENRYVCAYVVVGYTGHRITFPLGLACLHCLWCNYKHLGTFRCPFRKPTLAAFITTGNAEISDFSAFTTTGNC